MPTQGEIEVSIGGKLPRGLEKRMCWQGRRREGKDIFHDLDPSHVDSKLMEKDLKFYSKLSFEKGGTLGVFVRNANIMILVVPVKRRQHMTSYLIHTSLTRPVCRLAFKVTLVE